MLMFKALSECDINDKKRAKEIGQAIIKELNRLDEFCMDSTLIYDKGLMLIETVIAISLYGEPLQNYGCSITIGVGDDDIFIDCQIDDSSDNGEYLQERIQDLVTECLANAFMSDISNV